MITVERIITVWPGAITRDDPEVQRQTQKLREMGCEAIEYEQVEDHTAKLVGRVRVQ